MDKWMLVGASGTGESPTADPSTPPAAAYSTQVDIVFLEPAFGRSLRNGPAPAFRPPQRISGERWRVTPQLALRHRSSPRPTFPEDARQPRLHRRQRGKRRVRFGLVPVGRRVEVVRPVIGMPVFHRHANRFLKRDGALRVPDRKSVV